MLISVIVELSDLATVEPFTFAGMLALVSAEPLTRVSAELLAAKLLDPPATRERGADLFTKVTVELV